MFGGKCRIFEAEKPAKTCVLRQKILQSKMSENVGFQGLSYEQKKPYIT